jgi:hypothetical protein
VTDARIRRCSKAVLAVQAVALGATFVGLGVDLYVAVLAAIVQVVLGIAVLGFVGGVWLVGHPRGAALTWLLAMPAMGTAASVASLCALGSIRWGC